HVEEVKEPLGGQADIRAQGPFDSATGDAAPVGGILPVLIALLVGVLAAQARPHIGMDEGAARRRVEEDIVVRPADPAAHRAEKFRLRGVGLLAQIVAARVEERTIALDAEDERARLPIPPDPGTEERPGTIEAEIERSGEEPVRSEIPDAGKTAQIEPAPIMGRGWDVVGRMPRR